MAAKTIIVATMTWLTFLKTACCISPPARTILILRLEAVSRFDRCIAPSVTVMSCLELEVGYCPGRLFLTIGSEPYWESARRCTDRFAGPTARPRPSHLRSASGSRALRACLRAAAGADP